MEDQFVSSQGSVESFNNDPLYMVNPQETLMVAEFSITNSPSAESIVDSIDDCIVDELTLPLIDYSIEEVGFECSAIMSPISNVSSPPYSPARSRSASFAYPEEHSQAYSDHEEQVVEEPLKILNDLLEENRKNSLEEHLSGQDIFRVIGSQESFSDEAVARSSLLQVPIVAAERRLSTVDILSSEDFDDLESMLSGVSGLEDNRVTIAAMSTHVTVDENSIDSTPLEITAPVLTVASASAPPPKKSTRGRKRKINLDDSDYECVSKSRKQNSNKKAAQSYRERKRAKDAVLMKELEAARNEHTKIVKAVEKALYNRNLLLELVVDSDRFGDVLPSWVAEWRKERREKN